MDVNQIKEIVNSTTKEVLGNEALQVDDLSKIVDLGTAVYNANARDNYVKTLIDHIGKVVFVNRPYAGSAPSVLMDGWEYGSVLEKISMNELPEAEENDTWKLTNGQSYDTNVFKGPSVSSKFFNSMSTYQIQMSFAERQVKSAFDSAQQLNAFMSMIETSIQNSMTIKLDELIMHTINNMSAQTIHDGNGNRVINLLTRYNAAQGTTLTADKARHDKEFLRWSSMEICNYACRLMKISTLFNVGGAPRFTPQDRLHIVMLDEFLHAVDTYLYADIWHENYIKLPAAESVPYWQGSGLTYDFNDTSAINVQTDIGGTATAVNQKGIVCVMFDREALGVTNENRRVTTDYNARGEFINNWYKYDAGFFNDLNENFIVFTIADAE